MSYVAPYIDSSGLHLPSYQDIIDDLVAQAKNIFGQDIYLGVDSQDYQLLSAFANKIYDTNLLAQAVYNARGPAGALGTGLDIVVGLNGLQRQGAVYSTCPVVLSGTAGTVITNGVVADVNGIDWSLPSPVTIGSNGTVTVTATCQTAGAITANPGDIDAIVTPTQGWTSVTNSVAATVGSPQESDSALRARQAVSTAQPSQSMLEGLQGALAATSGVKRFRVYKNDTASADSNNLPGHSITCVVEGGTSTDIANAIWIYKGPGVLANGSTSVSVTDSFGVVTSIGYDVLAYEDIDVVVNLTKQTGWTDATATAIQNAIASYLNSGTVGGTLHISSLWGAALSALTNPAQPTFAIQSITDAVHGSAQAQGTTDIVLPYNTATRGNTAYITVNAS